MAQTCQQVVLANGMADKIHVIHKDARYVKIGQQRGNVGNEMQGRADLMVFEVRMHASRE